MENWGIFTIVFLAIYIVLTRIVLYRKLLVETGTQEPVTGTQEPVYDSVSLEEAEFTNGEKYILAGCTMEQYQQLETTGRPIKLGYFTKEGWTGGLPFYLFKCPACQTVGVDYKHGLRPYLHCEDCQASVTFRYFTQASKKHSV